MTEKHGVNIILFELPRYYTDPIEYVDWKHDFLQTLNHSTQRFAWNYGNNMNTDCPCILESMAIYDDNRRITTPPLSLCPIYQKMKQMILYKLPSMRLID